MRIGRIYGKISLISSEGVMVDAMYGVCYLVFVPISLLSGLILGSEVDLFIHTEVKEDALNLYGFQSYEELIWFRSLLKVSGVGSKSALNIISSIGPDSIAEAIQDKAPEVFKSVSGLGEKTAQRIVNDLKSEVAKNAKIFLSVSYDQVEQGAAPQPTPRTEVRDTSQIIKLVPRKNTELKQTKNTKKVEAKSAAASRKSLVRDAVSAMKNLGFDEVLSYSIASGIVKEDSKITLENLISRSLKQCIQK